MHSKIVKRMLRICQDLYDLPDSNKHFSFILDKNVIVSVGWNQSHKTHPIAAKFGHRFSGIHSELHAIKNFKYPIKELPHFTFVNIRLMKNRTVGLSKPCKHCSKMLSFFEVGEVWYSNFDKFELMEIN